MDASNLGLPGTTFEYQKSYNSIIQLHPDGKGSINKFTEQVNSYSIGIGLDEIDLGMRVGL